MLPRITELSRLYALKEAQAERNMTAIMCRVMVASIVLLYTGKQPDRCRLCMRISEGLGPAEHGVRTLLPVCPRGGIVVG